jgi:hypothetical protein
MLGRHPEFGDYGRRRAWRFEPRKRGMRTDWGVGTSVPADHRESLRFPTRQELQRSFVSDGSVPFGNDEDPDE